MRSAVQNPQGNVVERLREEGVGRQRKLPGLGSQDGASTGPEAEAGVAEGWAGGREEELGVTGL